MSRKKIKQVKVKTKAKVKIKSITDVRSVSTFISFFPLPAFAFALFYP
jgi:hypothetical protein